MLYPWLHVKEANVSTGYPLFVTTDSLKVTLSWARLKTSQVTKKEYFWI